MRLLLLLGAFSVASGNEAITITNHWNGGFQGYFRLNPTNALHGWRVKLIFDRVIQKLEIWRADVVPPSGTTEWTVQNKDFNIDIAPNANYQVDFVVRADGDQSTASGTFRIEDESNSATTRATTLPTTLPTTTQSSNGGSSMKYDYANALKLSILFFDAQRSGQLPSNNPIPWRGNSAVNDGDNGHDLSGGWYDAGDHVKFNLPMASSSWILNYGFLKFTDAYERSGQKNMMCEMVKWPLEYFFKSWIPSQKTLYVQVGDGHTDHSYWGRPENMNMPRPAFKVDEQCHGSDVAGDTVAAMASGYLVFKDICGDTTFSSSLLTAAKSLYAFAKNNRGKYTDCVSAAVDFYRSTGEADEMATAAAWLYKATNDSSYLDDAKMFYPAGTAWGFSWNDANVGAALLLYEETKASNYQNDIENFLRSYMPGGSVPMTPCGLSFRNTWGPNRYAANAAFIATVAAANGLSPNDYKIYAMSQINYLLGDNKLHISYEIGFGNYFPKQPHHRGSSCPTSSTTCDINAEGDNPNQLNGALVGGPDQNDAYTDSRHDYVKNEVACDYNAGFQGALAGLYHFSVNNALPAAPVPKC